MSTLHFLKEALSKPADMVYEAITELMVEMPHEFNEKCIKCILRIRYDIPRPEKIAMLKRITENIGTLEEVKKKNLGRLFKMTIMIEVNVRKFVDKLRFLVEERKKKLSSSKRNKLNRELNNITLNAKLEIEEATFTLRGYLEVCMKKFSNEGKRDEFIEKCEKYKYQKAHFSFLDDIFVWKKKPNSDKPELRIFMTTID